MDENKDNEIKSLFDKDDFDLFQETCWTDKVYNIPRMEVKANLVECGKILEELEELDPEEFTMETGIEHPALWNNRRVDRLEMFHMRKPEERKLLNKAFSREIPMSIILDSPSPLYAHPSIGLIIDENGLEVGYRLPYLAVGDKQLLRKTLAENPDDIKKLIGENNLGFHLKTPVENVEIVPEKIVEQLQTALNQLDKAGKEEHRSCLGIIKQIKKTEDFSQKELIFEKLKEIYKYLIPFYKLVSWNSKEDQLDVNGLIQVQQDAIEHEHEKSEEKLAEIRNREAQKKEKIEEEQQKTFEKLKKQVSQFSRKQKFKKKYDNSRRYSRRKSYKKVKSANSKKINKSSRPSHYKPSQNLTIGDEIIITAGLFNGQEGKIVEINGKEAVITVKGIEIKVKLRNLKSK
ncbi:MAG: hypothetical protein ACQES9_09835 [Myxococcota bacterium]